MSSQPKSRIDQTKSGMRVHVIPRVRMLWIVTMKLIAPASDGRGEDVEREDPEVLPVPGAWIESGGYARPARLSPRRRRRRS